MDFKEYYHNRLNEDGTMARLPQLGEIAAKFGLKIVSIKDIQEYRKKHNL